LSEISHAGELLGERIRDLRKKRGLTQIDLAERTGLPQSHVSEVERGMSLPNVVTLLRLAIALDCKVTDLVSVFNKRDLKSLLPQ